MSNTSDRLQARAEKLVEHVQDSVATRPGERAALRRSLGCHPDDPTIRPAARRLVSRYVHEKDSEMEERAFYAVAALIAAQPRNTRDHQEEQKIPEDDSHTEWESRQQQDLDQALETFDLGSALAQAERQRFRRRREKIAGHDAQEEPADAARQSREDNSRESPQEKRLHLLCRQDLDGLHRHLPRVVRYLDNERVGIDWPRLACDLARWGPGTNGGNRVAKQWLDGYYRTLLKARNTQWQKPNEANANSLAEGQA